MICVIAVQLVGLANDPAAPLSISKATNVVTSALVKDR
jgi:hypothetical protein